MSRPVLAPTAMAGERPASAGRSLHRANGPAGGKHRPARAGRLAVRIRIHGPTGSARAARLPPDRDLFGDVGGPLAVADQDLERGREDLAFFPPAEGLFLRGEFFFHLLGEEGDEKGGEKSSPITLVTLAAEPGSSSTK